MRNSIAVLLLAVSFSTHAQSEGSTWKDSDGNPVPNTESQKSLNGFAGMILITPDEDWEEKWNTPSDHTPHFTTTTEVEVGGRITTLIFLVNPGVNDKGEALVTCDIRVVRPDGSISVNVEGTDCFWGPVMGDKYNVRLAAPVLGFIGEATDPLGEWVTEVRLLDTVRSTELFLKTTFTLVASDT